MAYIVNTTQTATAVAATYTVTLGAHQTNDLLLVLVSQDGGGTNITTASSGWAMIGTGAASGSSRSQWAYKVAASGAEANPQFSGANDDWIGTCIVVRDADPTTPFGSLVSGTDFVRTDWNNVSSSASGALTTAVDECLLLYSWASDGTAAQYMRVGVSQASKLAYNTPGNISHIVAFRQQQSSGPAPTVTMYNIHATEGGNGWVLAIRNSSGGALQPEARIAGADLKFYGSWSVTHDSITWQAADQFAASINGISCGSTSPSVITSSVWFDDEYGFRTDVTTANSTAGEWSGGVHSIASTNMTGKIFSVALSQASASSNALYGAEGTLIGFSDGTNWSAFQVLTKEIGWGSALYNRFFIDVENATPYASNGSVNWAAVTKIAYLYHRAGSVTTAGGAQIKSAVLFEKISLTGGGVQNPANLQGLVTYSDNFGVSRVCNIQSSAQAQARFSIQIGDGTNKTYFDGAAQSFEFPQAWTPLRVANGQTFWNVPDNQVALTIKAGASDTIKLAAGVAATDTLQALTIDAASNTGAAYDFGQSFVGWVPTWKTGVPCVGATFAACDPVNFKGASPSNVTVKTTLAGATEAAVVFDESGATLTNSTIDVTGTAAGYHIELGTSVTAITLASVTLTGTPGTDKIHVKRTTGTVTITTSGTTSIVAGDVTSDGATVVISAPQVYQSVSISGLVAGSRVQIYDTTSSTELSNAIVAGTSTTWTDGSAAVSNRAIRVRITKVSGATAYEMIEANIGTCGTTAGTESVSYLANQVADTTYNTNAIDGSTVTNITIDDTTNLVKIAIPGGSVTWPQIYAYQVYWLNTQTGIQDDFAFIEAPDTANYLLTGFQIKNTSSPSVPLVISSGYGRDATTGASVDLVDTSGGTLIFAPDHVVAYSSGSGLTAGQDAKLTAINAACDVAVSTRLADTTVIEAGKTFAEVTRITAAALAGTSNKAGNTITFKGLDGTTDRIVGSFDAENNRTGAVLDGS